MNNIIGYKLKNWAAGYYIHRQRVSSRSSLMCEYRMYNNTILMFL